MFFVMKFVEVVNGYFGGGDFLCGFIEFFVLKSDFFG